MSRGHILLDGKLPSQLGSSPIPRLPLVLDHRQEPKDKALDCNVATSDYGVDEFSTS